MTPNISEFEKRISHELNCIDAFTGMWRNINVHRNAQGKSPPLPTIPFLKQVFSNAIELWQYNRRPHVDAIYHSEWFTSVFEELYSQCENIGDKIWLLAILSIATSTRLYTLSQVFTPEFVANIREDYWEIDPNLLDQNAQEHWTIFSFSVLQDSLVEQYFNEFEETLERVNAHFANSPPKTEYTNKIKYFELFYHAIKLEWPEVEKKLELWHPELTSTYSAEFIIKKAFIYTAIPRSYNYQKALGLIEDAVGKLDEIHLVEQLHFFEAYFYLKHATSWGSQRNDEHWRKFQLLNGALFSFNKLVKNYLEELSDKKSNSFELPEKERQSLKGTVIRFGLDPDVLKIRQSFKVLNIFINSGILPSVGFSNFVSQEIWENSAFRTYEIYPYLTLYFSLSYAGINYPEEKWLRLFLRKYIHNQDLVGEPGNWVVDKIFRSLRDLWPYFDPQQDRLSQSLLTLLSEFLIVVPYYEWRQFFIDVWELFNSAPDLKKYLFDDIRYGSYYFIEAALPYLEDENLIVSCLSEFLSLSQEDSIKINLLASINDNPQYIKKGNALVTEEIKAKINDLISDLPSASTINIKALHNVRDLLSEEDKKNIASQIKALPALPSYKDALITLNNFASVDAEAQQHLKQLIINAKSLWNTGVEFKDNHWVRVSLISHVFPLRRLSSSRLWKQGLEWTQEEIMLIYNKLVSSCEKFKESSFGHFGLKDLDLQLVKEMYHFLQDHSDVLQTFRNYRELFQEIEQAYFQNPEAKGNRVDLYSRDERILLESLTNLGQQLANEEFLSVEDKWKDLLTRIIVQLEPRLDNCLEFMVDWIISLFDLEAIRSSLFIEMYKTILERYVQIYPNHKDPIFIQTQMIKMAQVMNYWKVDHSAIGYFLKLKEESPYLPIRNLPALPKEISDNLSSIAKVKGAAHQDSDGKEDVMADKDIEPIAIIEKIGIQNFKSINNAIINLGTMNVFIGENGAGKSNILEALVIASAASVDKLDYEFLKNRGFRIVGKELFKSAFNAISQSQEINIQLKISDRNNPRLPYTIKYELDFDRFNKLSARIDDSSVQGELRKAFRTQLGEFMVYSPEYSCLQSPSLEGYIDPLGVHGEGLINLLKQFQEESPEKIDELNELMHHFGWFKSFSIPEKDSEQSNNGMLLIQDRFLHEGIHTIDQRSANEGFLFSLFYFCLILSSDTPRIFAIDNIDSSLNPKLCSSLIRAISELAKKYNKQVLVTTHNPAILDGIDQEEPDEKIFVVSRNLKGHTRVRQIKYPEPLENQDPIRLSEAFIRGYLGGLPEGF